MTKQEFLTRLKTKLSILSQDEIQDILDEYSEIINEKIAEGKTEQEAVFDFGDLDELSSEILKAYKINENYSKTENWSKQASDILNDLTKFLNDFFSHIFAEMSTQGISNMIVTIITAIILCILLRIPFWIIELLGSFLLNLIFPHFLEGLLIGIWEIICSIGYLIFAAGLILNLIKNREGSYEKKFSHHSADQKDSPRQRPVFDAEYREKH